MKNLLILLALVLPSWGCSHHDSGEDYGATTLSELVLTQANHAPGWQRTECFDCHLQKNLHQGTDSVIPGIDLEAIRKIVAEGGEASCSVCHGSNGN